MHGPTTPVLPASLLCPAAESSNGPQTFLSRRPSRRLVKRVRRDLPWRDHQGARQENRRVAPVHVAFDDGDEGLVYSPDLVVTARAGETQQAILAGALAYECPRPYASPVLRDHPRPLTPIYRPSYILFLHAGGIGRPQLQPPRRRRRKRVGITFL